MSKIWLVTGTSGEYSDRCYWNVRAFTTKKEAERFRTHLMERYAIEHAEHERLVELRSAIVRGIGVYRMVDAWQIAETMPEFASATKAIADHIESMADPHNASETPEYSVEEIAVGWPESKP